jgi:glucose-1-phosphate adenylyltransferase
LKLTSSEPAVQFLRCQSPIYTHARFLPGSTVEDSKLQDVLIAEGCRIRKAEITHSIVGIRSQIAEGTVIKDSILMGADYYDAEKPRGNVPIGIGRNCHIESAILDKNVRIGDGVIIKPFPRDHGISTTSCITCAMGSWSLPRIPRSPPGHELVPDDKNNSNKYSFRE